MVSRYSRRRTPHKSSVAQRVPFSARTLAGQPAWQKLRQVQVWQASMVVLRAAQSSHRRRNRGNLMACSRPVSSTLPSRKPGCISIEQG